MMSKKVRKRGWLRPLKSTGPMTAYHWIVDDCSYTTSDGEHRPHIDADFTLRDCSGEICLSCFSTKRKHIEKHRHMIDKLIDELITFSSELEDKANRVMDDE